jgi:hypothetical protein
VLELIYPMQLLEASNRTDGGTSAASNRTGWALSLVDEVRLR